MKKKYFFLIAIIFALKFQSKAQEIYIKSGKVEYEKQLNLFRFLGDKDAQSLQLKRNDQKQFKTTNFELKFTASATSYEPIVKSDEKFPFFFAEVAAANKVYNNLQNKTTLATKFAFDKEFGIADSLLNFKWKLTNETRPIAGFTCRKAVGTINDTLYFVAFFAEDIICSGGPEGVTGLPGLILGLAFPRLHVTWFATKVTIEEEGKLNIKPPVINKPLSRKQLVDKVLETTKTFGLPKAPVYYQLVL